LCAHKFSDENHSLLNRDRNFVSITL